MLIFLKAKLPGDHTGDLLAAPVQVHGYTTRRGTFVAPHASLRHKRPGAPQGDLFAPRQDAPAAAKPKRAETVPQADLFAPRQPAGDGTDETARRAAWQASGEKAQSLFSAIRDAARESGYSSRDLDRLLSALLNRGATGAGAPGVWPQSQHEDAEKVLAKLHQLVARQKKAAPPAEAPPAAEAAPTEPTVAAPAAPLEWGVRPGTGKAERRRLNAAAMAILEAKPDADMTAEDRQALARYTGRGGIGDSLNEFYTEPAVASAMWSMLANAGFAGGEVLEPSAATGVFVQTAPAGARVTSVEIDPTSARINRILHAPAGHEVETASLERFATQDGRQFDAVIGNVPFGVRGAVIKDDKPDLSTADQYFVDTALDKAKDGGLVALIVPTGILDSKTGRGFRERVLRKGIFLGAHRLPNTAFEGSHTGVTSDIVLFRKRPQDAAGALSTVTQDQLQALDVWDPEFLEGSYFTDGRGAGHVMGRMEEGWRAKAGLGHDITVTGSMAGIPEALAKWHPDDEAPASPSVQQVLAAIGDDPAAKRRAVSAAMQTPYQVPKLGDTRVINGIRYVLQGEPPRWHRAEDAMSEAVEDAQGVAEMIDDLAEGRARDAAFNRAALIEALDNYVRLHGVPSRNRDLLRWLAAPSLALEEGEEPADHAAKVKGMHRRTALLLGAVRDDGSYSDLVTGRTERGDAATLDTVATKLALETGGFTAAQLATAWGRASEEAVTDHLYASADYALDADGRTWTTMDSYLSGELWPKIDAARELAGHDGITAGAKAKYARQAGALEEVIQPQSLDDVEIMVNSGFVGPDVLTAWLRRGYDEAVEKNPARARWEQPPVVSFSDAIYAVRGADGGRIWGDADLLQRVLNRTGVKKDEQGAVERLNQDFREWLLGSAYRDQVEDTYNRTYRGFRQRAYADTPIAIPGLNPALSVNAYHFAGLRWAMEAGKGIIAADVGLGKTGRGLMLARLAKVTGQAKRPTFVVPKSVLANWMAEAEFWFPGSKVLVIGETYSKDKSGNIVSKPDNEETRRRKYHDLKQNEYDFVFISMPAWNDLDLDPIKKGEYHNQDFWVQRGAALGTGGNSKREVKIREAYDQAMAKRDFSNREDTIYFNDLGVDMLILDEGQAYKNLYSVKKRFGESPKFLGGGGESNRALDTYYKTKALREANGGKGVYMLTATPTKNSPLEVYSMLSHIAPEAFERLGIKNSEDFLDRFCVFENDTVLTTSGALEDALVTAGFKNLSELREVMRRYIDRKTAEDVGLVIPRADAREHAVAMTPEQETEYAGLRALALESKSDANGDAHIFSIMDKMGKASLDLGLLDPAHAGARSPKIDALVEQFIKGVEDGGQVVFCDSVPTHERIVAALVKAGIPRNQIGVINAQVAPTSAQRQRISDDFNAGKLKGVVGNTATMGEGINLQKGTADIHHLDLPWEPASVQQRNGRGRRQGNKKESIRLHTYLAKGSFDGYRWQTVGAKRDWMDLLWNGGDRVENLARQARVGRQDMLIMLSADPDAARTKYEADRAQATQRKLAEDRGKAADQFARLQTMRASLAKLQAAGAEGQSTIRLLRKVEQATSALHDNPHFPDKAAIDLPGAALFEPVSGHLWRPGAAMEIAPGDGSPIEETGTTKWVVTDVDVPNRKVSVRRYGGASTYPLTLAIDKMQRNVTPIEYSAAAEAKEVERGVAAAAKAAEGHRGRAALESGNITGVKSLPPEVVEQAAPAIQAKIKKAMRDYTDGYHQHYALLSPEGQPVLATSHKARDLINTHDLLLPTAEGRRQAIEGYVDAALRRKIATRYRSTGRRGRGPSMADGVHSVYPAGTESYETSSDNPWARVMHDVFPGDVAHDARKELDRRVLANVEAAPTFAAAVRAALPGIKVPEWGPYTREAWPAPIAAALRAKAERDGVLDQTMAETGPAADANGMHPDLFKLPGHGGRGPLSTRSTVRDFLAAMDAAPAAGDDEGGDAP